MKKSYIPDSSPHENPNEPVFEHAEDVILPQIFPNQPGYTLDKEFRGKTPQEKSKKIE